jgi:alpha-beta hydrolase superfamily lysophospholipase
MTKPPQRARKALAGPRGIGRPRAAAERHNKAVHLTLSRRAAVSAATALCCVALPAASAPSFAQGTDGTTLVQHSAHGFYQYPHKKQLHRTPVGGVIASERMRVSSSLSDVAGSATRLMYRSEGLRGKPVAVTGFLLVPAGKAPRDGWPVVAWAHGTSGVGPGCAPSKHKNLYPSDDYDGYEQLVARLLRDGYAVVGTDYQGLGFPGKLHDYMNLRLAGRAVVDSVRAAHHLERSLSKDWFTVGHSEGGHAALGTREEVDRRASALRFRGSAALAPASNLIDAVNSIAAMKPPLPDAAAEIAAYASYLAVGARMADPRIEYDDLLSPQLVRQMPTAERQCLVQYTEYLERLRPPLRGIVRPDWAENGHLVRFFEKQEPARKHVATPLLLLQGGADTAVPKRLTDKLHKRLLANGDEVQYNVYPGADHDSLLEVSYRDLSRWLDEHKHSHSTPHGTGS